MALISSQSSNKRSLSSTAEIKAWAWLATHLEVGSDPLVYQVGNCLTQPVFLGPDSRMTSPSELKASGLSTSSP
eukprot:4681130-Ditylum_brightwellii.AAC.1